MFGDNIVGFEVGKLIFDVIVVINFSIVFMCTVVLVAFVFSVRVVRMAVFNVILVTGSTVLVVISESPFKPASSFMT